MKSEEFLKGFNYGVQYAANQYRIYSTDSFIRKLLEIDLDSAHFGITAEKCKRIIKDSIELQKLLAHLTANKIVSMMILYSPEETVEKLNKAILQYNIEAKFRDAIYYDMLCNEFKYIHRVIELLGLETIRDVMKRRDYYVEKLKEIEMKSIEVHSCLLQRVY